jgi:hypothetical protein
MRRKLVAVWFDRRCPLCVLMSIEKLIGRWPDRLPTANRLRSMERLSNKHTHFRWFNSAEISFGIVFHGAREFAKVAPDEIECIERLNIAPDG